MESNFKNDSNERLRTRLFEHLEDTKQERDMFVICLQGSQNYGLDDEDSDIDSKLLVVPDIKDLVFNKPAVSYTHIMENDEHCDVKDVREYFKLFRKQNINFVEILFTEVYLVNEQYSEEWDSLQSIREELVRYDVNRALKCMLGMMCAKRANLIGSPSDVKVNIVDFNKQKQHALCHEYPSRLFMIEKYGFDPKQLSHIIRLHEFIERYIAGESYKDILKCKNKDLCLDMKRTGCGLSKKGAIDFADMLVNSAKEKVYSYLDNHKSCINKNVDKVLDETLYSIVVKSLKEKM